eukprot:CAMPEP_0179209750 /NCGR_PEP_ID=MMETSP0796-20121207/104610_1 /TAXON_ID=73915 /ORGANISM="Pyrodinium bahamense, Strain pbaha01" /LENGTH=709 /DNA_ID=CAMNT_0020914709 /DNA_START=46 /DNA_END=2175 /DNA_ORIENTATION=+
MAGNGCDAHIDVASEEDAALGSKGTAPTSAADATLEEDGAPDSRAEALVGAAPEEDSASASEAQEDNIPATQCLQPPHSQDGEPSPAALPQRQEPLAPPAPQQPAAAVQGTEESRVYEFPVPVFVRNTFLDTRRERSPSLEKFFEERRVHSCPPSAKLEATATQPHDAPYAHVPAQLSELTHANARPMQAAPMPAPTEVRPLRPLSVPGVTEWLTCGAKGLMRAGGKLYHEVALAAQGGDPQVGYLSQGFAEGDFNGDGVGDDQHGWAADGWRHKRWHAGAEDAEWPRDWCVGDVIGCAVDMDLGIMQFSLNGEWVPSAQMMFNPDGLSLFPAVSMKGLFRMNVPRGTWQFAPPNYMYQAWATAGNFTRPVTTVAYSSVVDAVVDEMKDAANLVCYGLSTIGGAVEDAVLGRSPAPPPPPRPPGQFWPAAPRGGCGAAPAATHGPATAGASAVHAAASSAAAAAAVHRAAPVAAAAAQYGYWGLLNQAIAGAVDAVADEMKETASAIREQGVVRAVGLSTAESVVHGLSLIGGAVEDAVLGCSAVPPPRPPGHFGSGARARAPPPEPGVARQGGNFHGIPPSGPASAWAVSGADSAEPESPVLGSPELPSRGSALHRWLTCKPCAFVLQGLCVRDVDCQFCHLCEPGERKRRRKAWLKTKREAEAHSGDAGPGGSSQFRASQGKEALPWVGPWASQLAQVSQWGRCEPR